MYHLSEAYLMASYISLLAIYLGALIFGTAAVAPIAVGSLAEDSAGIFFAPLLGDLSPLCSYRWPILRRYRCHWIDGLCGSFALCPTVGELGRSNDNTVLLCDAPDTQHQPCT